MSTKNFLIFILLVTLGVIFRLLPHPYNFTPVAALTLVAGVYLNKKYAFLLPITIMLLSDYFIGFYELSVMTAVYGSFLLIGFLSLWLRRHKNFANIIICSLMGSILFFIITNFAVWFFTPWYPKNSLGLLEAYMMAIPFFRNMILGDLFYTGFFFGLVELYQKARLYSSYFTKKADALSKSESQISKCKMTI